MFITKTHELIVGKKDVLRAINIFNKYQNYLLCGGKIDLWECGLDRYYIVFKTTNGRWLRMLNEFEELETLRVRD